MSDVIENDFIGRGWSFPLDVTANGTIATVGGARKLEQAMTLVLSTYPGERPFRPRFGAKLRDFTFEGATPEIFARIAAEVRDSLTMWEPRAAVRDVVVYPAEYEDNRLDIEITYAVKGENDERNLVYPFYTIPEERSE